MASSKRIRRRVLMTGALLSGTVFQLFSGTQCEWLVTRFDPCGTILANCDPGSFQLQFVENIPDLRVDPTCTIPGGCVAAGDPFVSPYQQLGPGFGGP